MAVGLYVGSPLSDCPPLCSGRTAPEVSEEEGSYTSHFYRWFLESSKSCLLLLVFLPGLIDIVTQLLARRSLLWLSMTWRTPLIWSNWMEFSEHLLQQFELVLSISFKNYFFRMHHFSSYYFFTLKYLSHTWHCHWLTSIFYSDT